MALCAMETVKTRLDKLKNAPASADVVQDCIRFKPHRLQPADAVSEVGCERPENWCRARRKPLPIGEVSRIIDTIVQILQSEPEITLRFHALSKLQAEDASGKTISFLWAVGKSNAGRKLWNLLRNSVISQHLATCEIDVAPTNSAEDRTCTAAGTDVVDDRPKHLVRILEK